VYLGISRNSSNNVDYFCIQHQTISISKQNIQFSLQQQQQQQQQQQHQQQQQKQQPNFKSLKFVFNIYS